MKGFTGRLRRWALALKRETLVVYFAARDPSTPPAVCLLALAVAAYTLSPIDLIPDFIPVLGLLDDIILVPLGIALVRRLVPAEVLVRARAQANSAATRPASRTMAAAIIMVWLGGAVLLASWAHRLLSARPG